MLIRNCVGKVVFSGEKVFLLKNRNGEWTLPRTVMRDGDLANEVALNKLKEDAGILAEIISTAGRTNYEFHSVSKQKPICNKIIWYVMKSLSEKFDIKEQEKFQEAGFFELEEAMKLISNSHDKALLHLTYKELRETS